MTRLCAIVLALLALAQSHGPSDPILILILISFDGWRWDYADRFPAPNLRALARGGVSVRQLTPVFPALTFPNHYTIATGLYPERHGIVANTMRDPAMPDLFSMSSNAVRESAWWGGEPIWVTAGRQGRRTAAMFWPGTEAEIQGRRPTYWKPFDGKMPAEARFAQVREWLALPESQRPAFITLYLDDVDHAGHDFGPDGPELRAAVATLDRHLGALVAAIRNLGLEGRTTVSVVSDHGMAPLSGERVIWLDDYIDVSAVEVTEWEGVLMLAPRDPTAVEDLYQRLRGAHRRLRIFTRDTMPARLHYRRSPRIAPIVGIPDDGWTVTTRERRRRRLDEGRLPQRATHGFDPASTAMQGIFAAAGPEVRRGLAVPSIENVHLYNFLCDVLHVVPAANDGDPERVSAWLRRSR